MFKLIKLCIYAFLGYALYELYQGMMAEQASSGSQSSGGQSRSDRRQRSRQNMTGAGQGQREMTEEPSGTSVSHKVGRGVVS